MARRNRKVINIRHRRPFSLNIGIVIFAVIFFYIAISVINYFSHDRIQVYEVAEGSIVNDANFSGIIFRNESVMQSDTTGYINFFVREGKRAARNAAVYSVDETGDLGKFLAENQSQTEISEDSLSNLKKQLHTFAGQYNDNNFSSVYTQQYTLQNSVSEYMSESALSNLQQALKEQGISYETVTTSQAGVVSYIIDGFEGIDPSTVTADSFDRSKYQRSSVKAGDLTESGTSIYKLITSESWSVVFPLDDESKARFDGKTQLTIKPSSSDLRLTGNYSVISGSDGKSYGRLDFDKYMIDFVSDRFMDFEVITDEAQGLKIPITSVVDREFYTIPVEYLTNGGNGGDDDKGFNREVYSDSGQTSVEFTPVTIYNQTDQYVYVEKTDDGPLKDGDYLVKPDSSDRYQVGETEQMSGAFNINRGYAVFKRVEKLADNGEYMIVKENTEYGLAVYDHIVLDAKNIKDNQLIYQ